MKLPKPLFRNLGMFLLILSGCIAILSVNAWSVNKFVKPDLDINIKNFTNSFKLLNIRKIGDQEFNLILKNEYNKTITAFAIATPTYTSRVELLDRDQAILPGATCSHRLSLRQDAKENNQLSPRQYLITISAVIFEDSNSDGDPIIVERIRDARSGEKFQIGKIIAQLSNALNLPDSRLNGQTLNNLKLKLKDLPETSDQTTSVYFKTGLHNAKDRILHHLSDMSERQQQEGNLDLRGEITRIKEMCERKQRKL